MKAFWKLMNFSLVIKVPKFALSNFIGSIALTTRKGIVSFLSCKSPHDTWIVDTSASNYMTSFSIGISNYKPCKQKVRIILADGSVCTTTEIRDLEVNALNLNFVLNVPNVNCNLILISKITRDLNCFITFFPSCYKFQNLSSKKMIRNTK